MKKRRQKEEKEKTNGKKGVDLTLFY